MSFFKPKKDQCVICKEYEKAPAEQKGMLEENYKNNQERKAAAMAEKETDKERAKKKKVLCPSPALYRVFFKSLHQRFILLILVTIEAIELQQLTNSSELDIDYDLNRTLINHLRSDDSSSSEESVESSKDTSNSEEISSELKDSSSKFAPTTTLNRASGKLYNKSTSRKRKIENRFSVAQINSEWQCPNITSTRSLECGCDLPYTLRCSGDIHGLEILAKNLRESPYSVSLLDCTLKNFSFLSDARIFENISLHGLVISSGEIKRVHKSAFLGLSYPLQALGLPSNALLSVPWNAISPLTSLERLDLSNNKIKALGTADFSNLKNLTYLELTDNQISSVSLRTFTNLKNLESLKLGGNRLGDFPASLQAIGQCFNLRQLDLKANSISGPLTDDILPALPNLESLNLDRNLIKSVQNKALKNFSKLKTLSLQHNQIDVLQDHAFYGLGSLEMLDLSFNGIVAISSLSLQHLTRLTVLDLTHNFLRALTSDLIVPLPSLKELRLGGNDISIIAKNALDGAKELTSLSLEENPLSCDCTIRPFSEWLQESRLLSKDLLTATCVTPPRLEGAPLIQVPIESLSCDMDNIELDNANIIEQLEALSKQNYSTSMKDLSEMISLRDLHFSTDYGLILTWTVNFNQDEYLCDAIFVFKEKNINEVLIDKSPIHCESKVINGQNTVSVILPDSSQLDIGESYRFCLVLDHENNIKSDFVVGCSNMTKFQLGDQTDLNLDSKPYRKPSIPSDVSNLDKVSSRSDEISSFRGDDFGLNKQNFRTMNHPRLNNNQSYEFMHSLHQSFLPGLGLGVLITSIVVLLWGASRIRNSTRPNHLTGTTCYAASERVAHLTDPESGNRYLKLQATTNL